MSGIRQTLVFVLMQNHSAANKYRQLTDIHNYLFARDVIYTSRAYATMSVSVCL